MTDPFATAAVRDRVLRAWSASPARFREDANAEEDLALGGYRDRLVVELAQNAADAATAAGVPGRLRLTLRESGPDGPVLVAANTGASLTVAGVEALSTLRASAKRGPGGRGVVGRFGVGFAAVLAVTDEPAVLSRTGGVRWAREDAAALVRQAADASSTGLAEELQRRSGHVPVLRLPFATEGSPPQGFDTAVVLPLRDEAAADLVRALLDAVDDSLLLALPDLDRVEVDVEGAPERVVSGVAGRWHVVRRAGTWEDDERAALLADRPTEERERPHWALAWALPVDPSASVPGVLHAPTPTDEPADLPALLVASFPLDPTRRHVAPGPLTDRLVQLAADAYADLAADRAPLDDDVLRLVPVGLASGALDAALRRAVLARLLDVPLLAPVDPGPVLDDDPYLLKPRDAVTLAGAAGDDAGALAALGPVVDGLVAAPASRRAALRALGVRETALADVVDALPPVPDPPTWRARYAALEHLAADPVARESLAALPVPLADGRVVRGARGALLPTDDVPPEALAVLAPYGLRVVHPDATHPLLGRLGAEPVTARGLLVDPVVRQAVAGSPDSDDPDELADAVLGLVAAAVAAHELAPGDLPWLGDLALPDDEGLLAPASALALPGSTSAELLDPDEIGLLSPAVADRWDAAVLAAAGIAVDLAVLRVPEVDLDDLPEDLDDVDGLADWAHEVGPGTVSDLVVVRDLDVVAGGRWPEVVIALAASPATRAAVVEPVTVVGHHGVGTRVASYSAWWLRRELDVAGTLDPAAGPDLAGLLDPAPAWLADVDAEVRRALGVVGGPSALPAGGSALDPDLVRLLLDRLGDPAREVDAVTCLQVWRRLAQSAEVLDGRLAGDPPDRVRVLDGDGSRVVDAQDAVVVDDPRWLQRPDLGGLVVAPSHLAAVLADLLDVAMASDVGRGVVDAGGGVTVDVPDAARLLLPGAPATCCRYDVLRVDGVEVRWWVDHAGVHATEDGLADGLAWAAGEWPRREQVRRVLATPSSLAEVAGADAAG